MNDRNRIFAGESSVLTRDHLLFPEGLGHAARPSRKRLKPKPPASPVDGPRGEKTSGEREKASRYPSAKPRITKAARAEVERAIDDFRFWRDYQAAIDAADALARARGGDRIIIREDLPERFREGFDPSFDTPGQLEGDYWLYADLLIAAIRRHSTSAGPVATFLDGRDDLRWVVMPDDFCWAGPPHGESGLGLLPDECDVCGRVVAYRADRKIVIPGHWVDYQLPTKFSWVIDGAGDLRME